MSFLIFSFCAEQKKAAALYTQAGDYQKTARFYYKKAEDTYYQVRAPSCVSEVARSSRGRQRAESAASLAWDQVERSNWQGLPGDGHSRARRHSKNTDRRV